MIYVLNYGTGLTGAQSNMLGSLIALPTTPAGYSLVKDSTGAIVQAVVLHAANHAVGGTDSLNSLNLNFNKWSAPTIAGTLANAGDMVWDAARDCYVFRTHYGEDSYIGETLVMRGKNTSGGTLTKGTVVQLAGSVGASGMMEFEKYNGTKACLGVLPTDVLQNEIADIYTQGTIKGINTTTYTGILYAQNDGTMGLTVTDWIVAVPLNQTNNGTIQVRVRQNASNDLNTVHKTGNETNIQGDKGWAGFQTYTQGFNSYFGNFSGGNPVSGNGLSQLKFEYNSGGYKHYLTTEHNAGSTSNKIRFWLNNSAIANGSSAPSIGNENIFTLDNSGSTLNLNAPQGFMINGKIVTSVSAGTLTVAIKTLAGNDPSATEPVYVRIGNTVRTLTQSASISPSAGENWCFLGSAEMVNQEVDLFVYLGWSTTANRVVIGASRVPYARIRGDLNNSNGEDPKFFMEFTGMNNTDEIEVVGRFNAILGTGNQWSIPTTSIIINRPIFETRWLNWVAKLMNDTSYASSATATNYWSRYQISGRSFNFSTRQVITNKSTYTTGRFGLSLAFNSFYVNGGGILSGALISIGATINQSKGWVSTFDGMLALTAVGQSSVVVWNNVANNDEFVSSGVIEIQ